MVPEFTGAKLVMRRLRSLLEFVVFLLPVGCIFNLNENSKKFNNSHLLSVDSLASSIPVAALPVMGSNQYVIDLVRWGINNNGQLPGQTIDSLQAAIDWAVAVGYDNIKLPAGTYMVGKKGNNIYTGGIELHSNMVFELDARAGIQMAPHDKWNAFAVAITEKSHVAITGGTIRGDRDSSDEPWDGCWVN